MLTVGLLFAAVFLAYANGSNDNFKGVATLYGSGAASYRVALLLATAATFAGCLTSVYLAGALIKAFSGKGLVPDAVASSQGFLLAVAAGAATTVILATRIGMPISTTHALTGALTGAGVVAAGRDVHLDVLGSAFFLPLLVSPVLAAFLVIPLYKFATASATRLGLESESCVCIGPRQFVPVGRVAFGGNGAAAAIGGIANTLTVTAGKAPQCVSKYTGTVFGVTVQSAVDVVHYLSAMSVSFARGLNDTPKIAGLLLALKAFQIEVSMLAIAAAMALGGLVGARKVAETMSNKISSMNDGQALVANLVTAGLVISASRHGLPVSTTHVSVGAISGVGLVKGTAHGATIRNILMAWVATLPFAAVSAGLAMALISNYN